MTQTDAGVEAAPPNAGALRIACLVDVAPRKLGSLEAWMTGFAAECRHRGHAVDVFGHEPVHPEVLRAIEDCGAGWRVLGALAADPGQGIRRLRHYDVLHLSLFNPCRLIPQLAYLAAPARVIVSDHLSGPPPGGIHRGSIVKSWLQTALMAPRVGDWRVSPSTSPTGTAASTPFPIRERARSSAGLTCSASRRGQGPGGWEAAFSCSSWQTCTGSRVSITSWMRSGCSTIRPFG